MSTTARRDSDEGMTLIELLVAMGIFTIVIAVFMSGVVAMTRNTAQAQAVSDATTTARRVMDRFDKQVRYSSAINMPGFGVSGAYYVEYVVPSQTAGGTSICMQWRYDEAARKLQVRSWPDTAAPSPTSWSTMATGVRNPLNAVGATPANRPFLFAPTDTTSSHQKLTVVLDIGPADRAGALVSSTYVARNTTPSTATNKDQDGDGVADVLVCQGFGRP